jgi:phosphoribosylanthranilate isomerase
LKPYLGDAILAGGLDPTNVGKAISLARPWGVDVSSGVERNKRKDPQLIREFLRAVHALDGVPQ